MLKLAIAAGLSLQNAQLFLNCHALGDRHGLGLVLVEYVWKTGPTVLATTESATFSLPVGEHTVTLTVVDSGGNDSTETTTITVLSSDFPSISSLSPDNGPSSGGTDVTINGSGFTNVISVKFGQISLSGAAVEVVNESRIEVQAPSAAAGVPVDVVVETSAGMSNTKQYTYIASSPIEFEETFLTTFESPSVVRFGPNGKLYVAKEGQIGIFTVGDDLDLGSPVITTVAPNRMILGLAFDPLDTKSNPDLYFSHVHPFHGEQKSSSGEAINGKVSKASGANLEEVVHIITGLPVNDGDHGMFSGMDAACWGLTGFLFANIVISVLVAVALQL